MIMSNSDPVRRAIIERSLAEEMYSMENQEFSIKATSQIH